ncbi:MAG: molecular chaperone TorD family protein [Proteobacteria bacterium]|nr:molecular chaperone TorD family protein [Pseudomonadota bacterium]
MFRNGRWEASLELGTSEPVVAEEDRLRADCYALLARLLAAPPTGELIELVRSIRSAPGTPLGRAFGNLATTWRQATPSSLKDEYSVLFIGVTHGELIPYLSYYLTGFLHEKPLADLRGDMQRLGIGRRADASDPEDHIAALCEMMAGLITGAFGMPAPLAEQRRFFDRHIGCWAPRFFENLQAAKAASFYMPVGAIGDAFMNVETEAFAMAA